MAQREDLELQRRTAPEGSEKRGSGQKVPEGESKEERWSRGVTRWFRWSLSVADPFVCRCLTNPILLRFHTPLIEPDRRISRIRLSEKGSRFRPRKAASPRGKADQAEHIMEIRVQKMSSRPPVHFVLGAQPLT